MKTVKFTLFAKSSNTLHKINISYQTTIHFFAQGQKREFTFFDNEKREFMCLGNEKRIFIILKNEKREFHVF